MDDNNRFLERASSSNQQLSSNQEYSDMKINTHALRHIDSQVFDDEASAKELNRESTYQSQMTFGGSNDKNHTDNF